MNIQHVGISHFLKTLHQVSGLRANVQRKQTTKRPKLVGREPGRIPEFFADSRKSPTADFLKQKKTSF